MFGPSFDTRLLRLISHDRNKMTEQQIAARAERVASEASHPCSDEDFLKFTTRAGHHFNWRGKRILDVGCGLGDLANHLAMQGAARVVGVDISSLLSGIARSVAAKRKIANVEFVDCSFHDWATSEQFDYVISYEALDHIPDTRATLEKMASLTTDNGRIVNFASGFWLGPVGADHCDDFMLFPIPWRQLLFNEEALFSVRREKYRPTDPASSFRDIRGGLTMYTLSDYQRAITETGLRVMAWETNYQFKGRFGGVLYPVSRLATRVPRLGEYLVFSSFGVFAKQ